MEEKGDSWNDFGTQKEALLMSRHSSFGERWENAAIIGLAREAVLLAGMRPHV